MIAYFASQADSLGLLQAHDKFSIRAMLIRGLCSFRIFEFVERILQGLCRVLAATTSTLFAAFESVVRYRRRPLLLTFDYDPPDVALP
jgi:hypothetical protein